MSSAFLSPCFSPSSCSMAGMLPLSPFCRTNASASAASCLRLFFLPVSPVLPALCRVYSLFLHTAGCTLRPELPVAWTSSGELLPGNRVDLCPAWKTDTALLGAHADPDSCDPLLHQLFNGALHFWHLGAAATDRHVWFCTRDQHCKYSDYDG